MRRVSCIKYLVSSMRFRKKIHDYFNRTCGPIHDTRYTIHDTRAFTLIELLAVMAILVVVTGAILTSNSRFGGAVLLQNLAYDIGLGIRQAQIYGISVHRYGASDFSSGYGMHFDVSASPTTYVLFADVDKNGVYDQGELVESTDIGRGYKIKSLCATKNYNENCNFYTLDILFKRPEPDAYLTARNGNGQSCIQNGNQCQERASIIVESPREDSMRVVVEATGQIAVQ